MLIRIGYDPQCVVKSVPGELLLEVKYYSKFATALYLSTVDGYTLEEFDKNPVKSCATIFVGQRGGLSMD